MNKELLLSEQLGVKSARPAVANTPAKAERSILFMTWTSRDRQTRHRLVRGSRLNSIRPARRAPKVGGWSPRHSYKPTHMGTELASNYERKDVRSEVVDADIDDLDVAQGA